MHEQPEGYGQEPYPNQPQGPGPGGYPPSQPPYPGQPGQPPGQQPPYGQQPPPYGSQPPSYGNQQPPGGAPWGQPGGGGFGPQDPMGPGGWGPPPGPPPKSNSGPVIAVAAVAALVLLGGGGAIVWALSGDGGHKPIHPVAVSTPPPTAPTASPYPPDPSGFPSTFPTPSDPVIPTPSGSPTLDESMLVQAGDCVRISGKSPNLKMFKADCDDAPYKVLKRFSGTSDKNKCHGVSGYTTAFWAKSKKYSFLSYVLCLKHQ